MTSGIYGIKRRQTGQIYIGSSKSIEKRYQSHLSALRLGKHNCASLQRDYSRYGLEGFQLVMLEEVAPDAGDEYFREREEYHQSQYRKLYNPMRRVDGRTPSGEQRRWQQYAKFFAIPREQACQQWDRHVLAECGGECEVCYALARLSEFAHRGVSLTGALERIRDEAYVTHEATRL
jgi:hypothetical protein